MNTGLNQAKRSLPWGGLLFALLFAAVAVLVLLGTGERDREVLLLEDAAMRWNPLCFSARGEEVLLVLGDGSQGLVLRLDRAGHELSRQTLVEAPKWAGGTADAVLLRVDSRDGCVLVTLDPATLEETRRVTLPVLPRELMLFAAEDSRAAWTVSGQRDRVVIWSEEGEKTAELGEDVSQLRLKDGALWAAAGTAVSRLDREPVTTATLPAAAAALLPGSRVLGQDGVVYQVEEGTASAAFPWASPVYGELFFCLEGENGLIMSTAGEVSRVSPEGTVTGLCRPDGTLVAVCEAGALVRRDNALRYVPLVWEDPTVSPAPSGAPSAAPSAGPENPPTVTEGRWILLEPGTTVAQLRELFRPEAVDLRDASGLPVSRGICATGMSANEYILVIPGDCDGTGSLTQGDLRRATELMGDEEAQGSAYCRAADLTGDGVVDGDDLLALRALVEQEPLS